MATQATAERNTTKATKADNTVNPNDVAAIFSGVLP
eukprot:CAMPEP_0194102920 /NCGR_PEP_ID=MMETSP0150-20130528/3444_1 /TAXON_ID=122233 /ORGANISM="Chaetoceros debilis, Strain MM31A-1" /LENGTH=35 /DNA_ID= /DNA_START= /DNA_END= /DNA_ORIENTATION=